MVKMMELEASFQEYSFLNIMDQGNLEGAEHFLVNQDPEQEWTLDEHPP